METYVVLRRGGWRSIEEAEEAADRSNAAVEQMSGAVAWIRSYVLVEPDGSIGSVCIYEAVSPNAIREHAAAAGIPVDDIIAVGDTRIVRADAQAITSWACASKIGSASAQHGRSRR